MDNRRSDAFLCRKLSLFTLILVWLIHDVMIMAIFINLTIFTTLDNFFDTTYFVEDWSEFWVRFWWEFWLPFNDTLQEWNIVIIVFVIISIYIKMVGLIGVFEEHKLLSLIHAIITPLYLIYFFDAACVSPLYWLYFSYNLIVCVIGFLFVRDLYRSRIEPPAPQSPMTTYPSNPAPHIPLHSEV